MVYECHHMVYFNTAHRQTHLVYMMNDVFYCVHRRHREQIYIYRLSGQKKEGAAPSAKKVLHLPDKKRNNKNIHIHCAYYMQNVNAFYIKIGKIREIFNVYCNFRRLKV